MNKILVVSENDILMRNLYEWFSKKIEVGDLRIDHARSREEAEVMMAEGSYNKIFHNGIFIVDAVERLQVGSDVYNYGKTNNNLFNPIVNPHDKKSFSRIFSKKYFQTGVNIGGYITAGITVVTVIVALITFSVVLRNDVDINQHEIGEIKEKIDTIGNVQTEVKSNVDKLVTIFGVVYGDKLKVAIDNKKIPTIGDK